mmetsp:Transcript_7707/g.19460  ORF Transcript_7707/g.19460 Transcript_7707/m.19460 type:complete len:228 (+) Transcript_7707:2412-3095(+)
MLHNVHHLACLLSLVQSLLKPMHHVVGVGCLCRGDLQPPVLVVAAQVGVEGDHAHAVWCERGVVARKPSLVDGLFGQPGGPPQREPVVQPTHVELALDVARDKLVDGDGFVVAHRREELQPRQPLVELLGHDIDGVKLLLAVNVPHIVGRHIPGEHRVRELLLEVGGDEVQHVLVQDGGRVAVVVAPLARLAARLARLVGRAAADRLPASGVKALRVQLVHVNVSDV